MYDIHYSASAISNDWPSVVGKLPKAVTEAIDAHEAVGYVQDPYVAVDASAITAENAEQHVLALTKALAESSHFNEARKQALNALARRVLGTAGASVPEVIESLSPKFDAAVAEFTEAVSALPDDVSSDALVAAGPATLAHYHAAIAAQQDIARIDLWLDSLVNHLPEFAGQPHEPCLRVLRPNTRTDLLKLNEAASAQGSDALRALYVCAVNEGIEWEMHTPIEAVAVRAEIEAQPIERQPTRWLKV